MSPGAGIDRYPSIRLCVITTHTHTHFSSRSTPLILKEEMKIRGKPAEKSQKKKGGGGGRRDGVARSRGWVCSSASCATYRRHGGLGLFILLTSVRCGRPPGSTPVSARSSVVGSRCVVHPVARHAAAIDVEKEQQSQVREKPHPSARSLVPLVASLLPRASVCACARALSPPSFSLSPLLSPAPTHPHTPIRAVSSSSHEDNKQIPLIPVSCPPSPLNPSLAMRCRGESCMYIYISM